MYDEKEIENWEREGGKFLLENGIVIDTPDSEEVRKFKREIGREEIEKNGYENGLKKRFSFVKENERSNEKMSYIYDDSADNVTDNEKLQNLMEEFNGEKNGEGLEKQVKTLSEKLKNALKECYKTLNEYKAEISDIPDLFEAIKLLGKLATAGKAGKYPYPEKYPYPKKVKKSDQPILWSDMLEQMFGDRSENEDEDFEKSDEAPSRETPWPSFKKEFSKNARKIKKAEDQMERFSFDPYKRID